MQVVYAREDFPETFSQAIFLAGPTPRTEDTPSWRPEALRLLEEAGYEGVVFVPEPRHGWSRDYDGQIEWEEEGLRLSDCILFWIPRDLETMPAFTTNDEWGTWKYSGRVVMGAPVGAEKVRYQRHYAAKLGIPNPYTLKETVDAALEMVSKAAERTKGERFVPLSIWHSPSFQEWYGNLRRAGNRLDGARVVWTFFAPKSKFLVFWAIHADVFVASENRHKTNEVVLSRPSISSVLMFRPAENFLDTEVVLVREFRSPVSNAKGFVWELPGGSSFKAGVDPKENAASEVKEETSLVLDADRFREHGSAQLVATLSTHRTHLFSVELTGTEIEKVKSLRDQVFGNEADTERTFVEVWTLRQLRDSDLVDFSTKGMVFSVLIS
jgi:8-oxo-dGTP pyrophosphatase MutT (NUDIX family)